MSHDSPSPAAGGAAYRLAPLACRHIEHSRAWILRAAQSVEPVRAAILGAGACTEIPLAELAERFGEVVLNDIDERLLREAIAAAELSPTARARLKIVPGDLSGLTQPALAAIGQAISDAADAGTAIDAMAQAVVAAEAAPFPIPGPFDLVVASCVLSQLHFALTHEAAAIFEQRFPGQADTLRTSSAWQAALYATARQIEEKFIANLAERVSDRGLVCLSESAQMCYVQLAPDGSWQTPGTYRMLRTIDLADYVQGHFQVVERGRWEWVVAPPKVPGETGRLYDVQALVLRRAR
ncbi:MAG: hypothetical protein AB7O59_16505 [Pirellulales bacterium]